MDAGELADDLAETMARQLRLRGGSLSDVTARAGRRLPGHLKRDAEAIAEAATLAQNPKLAHRVDPKRLKRAERKLRKFLDEQDPRAERIAAFLDRLAFIVFVPFTLAVGIFLFALWRGYFG